MSVTTLDPKTALIVIDLQNGLVQMPTVHPIDEIIKKTPPRWPRRSGGAACRWSWSMWMACRPAGLSRSATWAGMPAGWTDLVPALNRQPQDHTVTKRNWGAFTNTDLEAYLKNLGVTQIVLAGVATSIGVESTARHARELGLKRHACHRCHDRPERRGSRQQPQPEFSRASAKPARPRRLLRFWRAHAHEERMRPLCRRLPMKLTA